MSSLILVPEDAEVEDNEEMRILAADFEIGHMLRDSIVPKAVLYYTGEAGDEDEDDVNILISSFEKNRHIVYSKIFVLIFRCSMTKMMKTMKMVSSHFSSSL